MASSVSLNTQPVEILVHVMGLLDAPRDLLALIQASRRVWGTFEANQVSVLVALVQRLFRPEVMSDAKIACDMRHLKAAFEKGSFEFAQAQWDFSNRYQPGRPVSPEDLRDPSLLHVLCQLWHLVDHFDRAFANDTRQEISTTIPAEALRDGWDSELTAEEYSRLQRAFIRYEICRRFFPQRNEVTSRSNSERASEICRWSILPKGKIFMEMPAWERDELLAALSYVFSAVERIHLRACEGMLSVVGKYAESQAIDHTPAKTKIDQFVSRFKLARSCEEHIMTNLVEREADAAQLNYLSMLGLPLIRWLADLPLEHQLPVIGNYWPHRRRGLWRLILKSGVQVKDPWAQGLMQPSIGSPNLVWAKTRDSLNTGDAVEATLYLGQPSLGYIFWSSERLDRLSFRDSLPTSQDRRWSATSFLLTTDRPSARFNEEMRDVQMRYMEIALQDTTGDEVFAGPLQPSQSMKAFINEGNLPNPYSNEEAQRVIPLNYSV